MATPFDAAIAPPRLEAIRATVLTFVPDAKENFDRRGFRLLHWPSPVSERKPIELSLEHETRLKPTNEHSVPRLLAALQKTEDHELGQLLLPGDGMFGELVLQRVPRSPGSQSLDWYFDTPNSGSGTFLTLGYTFRQRLRGRNFMTWNAGEGMHALNLEFPSVDLRLAGLTARLEFNWLDNIDRTLDEAFNSPPEVRQRNPVFLAQTISGVDLKSLKPVVEIDTVRHKYLAVSKESNQAELVINVDLVSARDLGDGSTASFADVDLSCVDRIGESQIVRLFEFTRRMAEHYELTFNPNTKASRALAELGTNAAKHQL